MEIRVTQPKLKLSHDSPYDNQDRYAPSDEEVLESKIGISGFSAYCYVTPNGETLRKYLKKT